MRLVRSIGLSILGSVAQKNGDFGGVLMACISFTLIFISYIDFF